jgi:hypothetical protein
MTTTHSAYTERNSPSCHERGQPQRLGRQNIVSAGTDAVRAEAKLAGLTLDSKTLSAASLEFSASHDVFSAVDDFYNLGASGRFDAFHKLSPEEKEQFVRMVAKLSQLGYVGYEERLVNHKVERHDVVAAIGDERLRNAPVLDWAKHHHRCGP